MKRKGVLSMPKRIMVDKNLIYNTWIENNKNGRDTAFKLGIHPNTVYQVLRSFQGKCRSCKNEIPVGDIYCNTCKKLHAEHTAAKRKAAVGNHICSACGKPVSIYSRVFCDECLEKSNIVKRQSDANTQKAIQCLPIWEKRLESVRRTHGAIARDFYREHEGVCCICGASWDKIAVHLHHIDGNHKNKSAGNYALLCFDCHMLVHKVLENKNVSAAITWIKKTYPFVKF
jgi:hypothetical protein